VANEQDALRIDTPDSKVAVWVIPTDEEQVIADEMVALLFPDRAHLNGTNPRRDP
jgi:acetate kinase